MKKVRAMLLGIAILAFVGGIFAFKAKSAFNQTVYYTTYTTNRTTACNLSATTVTTSTLAAFEATYYYSITDAPTTTCTSHLTYVSTPD